MPQQNRRDFLGHSLLSAAATAGNAVFGSTSGSSPIVTGEKSTGEKSTGEKSTEPKTTEPQSKSANERLRVAVIGVRGYGREHIQALLQRKDVEIAAIVDADKVVGQKKGVEPVKKKTGKSPKFYTDLRKMLDDKSIDVVTIATPNHWHALAAIWAIQHGKDVYCEGPVSHNVSEGRRIVQAARKHKKIVQSGLQCRSMKGSIDAINYVHNGHIGVVKRAHGICYKPRAAIGPRGVYQVSKSIDYDLWLGPAPQSKLTRPKLHYDWHWQWPYGNGDLGNQGVHQIDLCRWGLQIDGLGDSVLSYGGRFGYSDAGETANTQSCLHTFGDKQILFEVRGLKSAAFRGAKIGVIFYGTQGYIVQTSYTKGAAFDLDGKLLRQFSGSGDHFGNFFDAVRSRRLQDLTADIEDGHLSSALCHLSNISYRLGSNVSFETAKTELNGAGKNAPIEKTDATEKKTAAKIVAPKKENAASGKAALELFQRMTEHLQQNKIDLKKSTLHLGKTLTIDSSKERFTKTDAVKANLLLSRKYRKGFAVPTEKEL